ncbi:uncharacterized protein [Montipora foliosa]|uniref:uncharacterized protein isoform X1 n=1 Tax=Montipora foliosa TaxID=591990 RepID=UPI0035F1D5ED
MPPNVKPCHMKMFSRSYKSYRTYKSCTCEGALDCFEGRGFVCQTLTSNIMLSSLSRMIRISENRFGILVSRWRIFCTPMLLEPGKVKHIVLAALTLHNLLRSDM